MIKNVNTNQVQLFYYHLKSKATFNQQYAKLHDSEPNIKTLYASKIRKMRRKSHCKNILNKKIESVKFKKAPKVYFLVYVHNFFCGSIGRS